MMQSHAKHFLLEWSWLRGLCELVRIMQFSKKEIIVIVPLTKWL